MTNYSNYPIWLGYMDMPYFLLNPKTIVSASGCTIVDDTGKEYIDLSSGIRNVILGYSQDRIINAVTEQMKKISFVKGSSFANEPAILLANEIKSIANVENSRILFHNSGTEAVEAAIKLVRQFAFLNNTKKKKIVTIKKGYHGQTITALSSSAEEYSKEPFKPYTNGFIFVDIPNTELAISKLVDKVEKNKLEIGAIMLEPILGNGGVIEIPLEYLKKIKEICSTYDIFLICDEVTTGFGRCGSWFLSNNVQPDIIITGKALTNGYLPLSAVIVSQKIWQVFDNKGLFRHGQTNLNHPICCACGLETLKILKEINAPKLSQQKGEEIKLCFKDLINNGLITSIRGKGLLWAIEFDISIHRKYTAKKWLENALLEEGLIVGQIDNTIFISPYLFINDEIKQLVLKINEIVK